MGAILENITDSAKFFIMLLIYTGYMTWWASGITSKVENNTSYIHAHTVADAEYMKSMTMFSTLVMQVQKQQENNSALLRENILQHAKCTTIMENVLKRLDKLEDNR